MSVLHTEERIGEAWRYHREGNDSEATRLFQEILKTSPKNTDAYYGLGLTQRRTGDTKAALESFQTALEIAEQAFKGTIVASEAEGHHGANDLDTSEDDRFMMLITMLKQRIDEVSESG